jgi:hypothetical protein
MTTLSFVLNLLLSEHRKSLFLFLLPEIFLLLLVYTELPTLDGLGEFLFRLKPFG